MIQKPNASGASVDALLRALGQRLKQQKRALKSGRGRTLTDEELAQRAGVSRSTVVRLWQGEPIGTDNLIRVIRALDCLDLLQALITEPEPTPLQRLQSARRRRTRRQAPPLPPPSARIPVADAQALRDKYGNKGTD